MGLHAQILKSSQPSSDIFAVAMQVIFVITINFVCSLNWTTLKRDNIAHASKPNNQHNISTTEPYFKRKHNIYFRSCIMQSSGNENNQISGYLQYKNNHRNP